MNPRRFYENTQGAPAMPTLLLALQHWHGAPAAALDLGCGAGRDTLELLRRGWQVTAIDAEPLAFEYLNSLVPRDHQARLQTRCMAFQSTELTPAELINASFSLPFCPPGEFPALWQRIEQALKPCGVFAGHFFGERDSWAEDGLSIHTRSEVERLFQDWQIIDLQEIDRQGQTAVGKGKHWHLFAVVARR
ncbi:class I SAM-dependent methyltransferase [Pseudomonas argentinensis]|uniref:Methyltransferase domain-containing protein n=1 Tax=Phytopseudomonas argentinensis TaxID=289370 RepID=A0A1I3KP71_9GAMM|nr:class I SAM-dependent methyltransferase [Pseudomonas argentinensis]KAB0550471.1 class I SAM-dependent methyltransferase [Pseudomonas argentinensis]SFI74313.1 Methyltransferase domain-containing protein [Pseudomonas argentinensis]